MNRPDTAQHQHLLVPMKNHKDEIVGVIQLINRKNDYQTKLHSENYRK